MATIAQIAEAVKVALAGGSFNVSFTPAREYLPAYDLEDLADLKVVVVPKGRDESLAGRGVNQTEAQVDIGVMKKLTDLTPATVDPLIALVEEIVAFFRRKNLTADSETAAWIRTENDPLYSTEHMQKFRQFTSVITLTYRLVGSV